jgi:hypothetical protein
MVRELAALTVSGSAALAFSHGGYSPPNSRIAHSGQKNAGSGGSSSVRYARQRFLIGRQPAGLALGAGRNQRDLLSVAKEV